MINFYLISGSCIRNENIFTAAVKLKLLNWPVFLTKYHCGWGNYCVQLLSFKMITGMINIRQRGGLSLERLPECLGERLIM